MLPILHRAPGAAPFEAVLNEKAIQEVALDDLVGEALAAVDILRGRGGLHDAAAVLAGTHIGVIERVDVDRHALSMLGELGGAGNPAVAEAGGVIIAHRPLVVGLVVINQTDALDGIFLTVELAEDVQKVIGNRLVADHLTHMLLLLGIIVRQAQIAEVLAAKGAAFRPGAALHPQEDRIGNGLRREHLSLCPDGSEECKTNGE